MEDDKIINYSFLNPTVDNTYESRDLLAYVIDKKREEDNEEVTFANDNTAAKIRLHIPFKDMENYASEFFESLSDDEEIYWKLGGNVSNVIKLVPGTLQLKFCSTYNSNNQTLFSQGDNYKQEVPTEKRVSGKYPWYLIVADIDIEGTKSVNEKINDKDILQYADNFKDPDGLYRLGSVVCINKISTGDINVIREAAIVKYFNEANPRYEDFISGDSSEEYLRDFLNFTIGKESLDILENNKSNVEIYRQQAKQLNELYSDDKYIALYNKGIIDFVKKALQLHIFNDNKYNIRLDKVDTTDIVILNLDNKEILQQLYNIYTDSTTHEAVIEAFKTNTDKQDYIGVSLKESNTQRLGTGYSFYETIENYDYWKRWDLNTEEWITKDEIYGSEYIDQYLSVEPKSGICYEGDIIRHYMNKRNINNDEIFGPFTLTPFGFYKACMVGFCKIINGLCSELGYVHTDYLMESDKEDSMEIYRRNINNDLDIELYRLKHNVSTMEAICTTLLYDNANIMNEPNLYVAISRYCAGSLFENDLYDNIFVKNGVVKEYPKFFEDTESDRDIIINTNGLKQTKGITLPMNIEIEDIHYGTCFLESISSGNKLMLKAKK